MHKGLGSGAIQVIMQLNTETTLCEMLVALGEMMVALGEMIVALGEMSR